MQIHLPTECPACGSDDLELVKDLFYCRNKQCSAQTSGKLQKFCKILKIKGFGPATLAKAELESLEDLVTVTPEYLKNKGFSDTMANKLSKAVSDRLQSKVTVPDFLAAMSIPNIGTGTANKLGHIHPSDISLKACKKAGLGDVAANSLITWAETEWPELSKLKIELLTFGVKDDSVKVNSTAVCITGKLNDFSSRGAAANYLQELGYEVKSGVTKAVQYLICEDGNTSSSSYKKAIAAGIPVKTIKQLLEE